MNLPRFLVLVALGMITLIAFVGCSSKPTPTPTAIPTPTLTPTPTFQQQREKVVAFLKQYNQLSNNYEDSFDAAGFQRAAVGGNLLEFNRAVSSLITLIEGLNRAISEITPPSGIRELNEIKNLDLSAAAKILQILKELQAAIQAGSSSSVQSSLNKFIALSNDPSIEASEDILEKLLVTYGIPDTEVNYRRQ